MLFSTCVQQKNGESINVSRNITIINYMFFSTNVMPNYYVRSSLIVEPITVCRQTPINSLRLILKLEVVCI